VLLNVLPYLRNHSVANQPSFWAASKILATLSEYQYTRKAWKREAMELLFDQAFFQMDVPSIVQWEKITDNLLMQDKKAHDEFIGRF
jgi:hypothetical protein